MGNRGRGAEPNVASRSGLFLFLCPFAISQVILVDPRLLPFNFIFPFFFFFLAIFTLQDSVNRKISKLGLLCTYDSFHQYGAYLGGRLDL